MEMDRNKTKRGRWCTKMGKKIFDSRWYREPEILYKRYGGFMEEHGEETNKELRLCPQLIVKPTMYVFLFENLRNNVRDSARKIGSESRRQKYWTGITESSITPTTKLFLTRCIKYSARQSCGGACVIQKPGVCGAYKSSPLPPKLMSTKFPCVYFHWNWLNWALSGEAQLIGRGMYLHAWR